MTLQSKRLTLTFLVIGLVLMIPLVAMQFTTEVNWSLSDFIIMGALLSLFGLLINAVLYWVTAPLYRLLLVGGLLFALFLIWAELAVGIFGSPFAGS